MLSNHPSTPPEVPSSSMSVVTPDSEITTESEQLNLNVLQTKEIPGDKPRIPEPKNSDHSDLSHLMTFQFLKKKTLIVTQM